MVFHTDDDSKVLWRVPWPNSAWEIQQDVCILCVCGWIATRSEFLQRLGAWPENTVRREDSHLWKAVPSPPSSIDSLEIDLTGNRPKSTGVGSQTSKRVGWWFKCKQRCLTWWFLSLARPGAHLEAGSAMWVLTLTVCFWPCLFVLPGASGGLCYAAVLSYKLSTAPEFLELWFRIIVFVMGGLPCVFIKQLHRSAQRATS